MMEQSKIRSRKQQENIAVDKRSKKTAVKGTNKKIYQFKEEEIYIYSRSKRRKKRVTSEERTHISVPEGAIQRVVKGTNIYISVHRGAKKKTLMEKTRNKSRQR